MDVNTLYTLVSCKMHNRGFEFNVEWFIYWLTVMCLEGRLFVTEQGEVKKGNGQALTQDSIDTEPAEAV